MSSDLIRALRGALPKDQVLTKASDLLCYAYDATAGDAGRVPDVVVLPASTDEVARVVGIARDAAVPVYPRGAGTSLSGGAIPARGGIVLSTARDGRRARARSPRTSAPIVQPGVVIQRLNDLAAEHGLMYPPDPGSVAVATMGGSIAECAGGLRGLKYGVTKHYVTGLEVVLADGQVVRLGGKSTKNVTGYDLVGPLRRLRGHARRDHGGDRAPGARAGGARDDDRGVRAQRRCVAHRRRDRRRQRRPGDARVHRRDHAPPRRGVHARRPADRRGGHAAHRGRRPARGRRPRGRLRRARLPGARRSGRARRRRRGARAPLGGPPGRLPGARAPEPRHHRRRRDGAAQPRPRDARRHRGHRPRVTT